MQGVYDIIRVRRVKTNMRQYADFNAKEYTASHASSKNENAATCGVQYRHICGIINIEGKRLFGNMRISKQAILRQHKHRGETNTRQRFKISMYAGTYKSKGSEYAVTYGFQ